MRVSGQKGCAPSRWAIQEEQEMNQPRSASSDVRQCRHTTEQDYSYHVILEYVFAWNGTCIGTKKASSQNNWQRLFSTSAPRLYNLAPSMQPCAMPPTPDRNSGGPPPDIDRGLRPQHALFRRCAHLIRSHSSLPAFVFALSLQAYLYDWMEFSHEFGNTTLVHAPNTCFGRRCPASPPM